MNLYRLIPSSIAIASLGFVWLASPPRAEACGGFFCNQGAPVNQNAERIIFAKNADGTVTAVVQILYSGPSERFAWVLPVPGTPDVGVSSNIAFQNLQNSTNPVYRLQQRIEGRCADAGTARSGAPTGASFDSGVSVEQEGDEVRVVDSGSVGPYDFVNISVDPGASQVSDVAIDWLQDNGYDVDDMGRTTLGPYLEAGMNLLAFRLTKGTETGSIRPIMLTYETERPSIPIRPTAVAADDDMGVMVWVLGGARAVPVNYRTLELNEALINWFNPNSTYNDVVIAAANEAGGQGFVTEMSGATEQLPEVFPSFVKQRLDEAMAAADSMTDADLLRETLGSVSGWDGVRETITEAVPVPTDSTVDELVSCVSCVYPRGADIPGFDKTAFLETFEANVVEPMSKTQELLTSLPHFSRLYTTMSASEMTLDPEFDFNRGLDDVSNTHVADQVVECNPSVSMFDAPWRILLPQGGTVRGSGTQWPFSLGESGQPINRRILQLSTSGNGEIITDNVGAITSALTEHNATMPRGRVSGGGGCQVATSAAPAAWWLMLTLFAIRRRQRLC